jgi:uncharacterized protein (TIGR02677 family)
MGAFYEAKQRFVVQMRPEEVLREVQRLGLHVEQSEEGAQDGDVERRPIGALDYHLDKLVEWGNLTRSHDTASVSRIEDFYRKRYLYHLSPVGEAAQRAVLEVEATVGRTGALQASMLHKIRDALAGLAGEGAAAAPDAGRLVRLLHDLFSAFDTLTQEANRFIGELSRHLSAERMDEQRFELHKAAVLAYISRFVEQLRRLSAEIVDGLEAIQCLDPAALIAAAARAAELPPALDDGDPVARWTEEQRARWEGVCGWFLRGEAGREPTVERLAGVARQAVVTLTRTLSRLDDRRTRRVDRAADFRLLARWFSACADDREAHRLYEAAFGLYPARHFHIAESDAEQTSPRISWWEAAPVEVPVRLRTRGRISEAGRPAPAVDFSDDKRWIAQRRRRERRLEQAALARFSGQGPLRLGGLGRLEGGELDALLGLLDEVLSSPRGEGGLRVVRTADGRHRVSLRRPAGEAVPPAELETERGRLRCEDFTLTLDGAARPATAGAGPRRGRDQMSLRPAQVRGGEGPG